MDQNVAISRNIYKSEVFSFRTSVKTHELCVIITISDSTRVPSPYGIIIATTRRSSLLGANTRRAWTVNIFKTRRKVEGRLIPNGVCSRRHPVHERKHDCRSPDFASERTTRRPAAGSRLSGIVEAIYLVWRVSKYSRGAREYFDSAIFSRTALREYTTRGSCPARTPTEEVRSLSRRAHFIRAHA